MSGMSLDYDPLLTPGEVARIFRVDPKTISRWALHGKLPCVRTPGGTRRFRTSDVMALYSQPGDLAPVPDARQA